MLFQQTKRLSLNPCFNGIRKNTNTTNKSMVVDVLILVLMEYEKIFS